MLFRSIARWNGVAWSSFSVGVDRPARAVAVNGADLYIGGDFTSSGANFTPRIAKWNGIDQWVGLNGNSGYLNGTVNAIAFHQGQLYAAGNLGLSSGSVSLNNVARWNGTQWLDVGGGVSSLSGGSTDVNALATDGQQLFATGYFTAAGGTQVNGIARWDGSVWRSLGETGNSIGNGYGSSAGGVAISIANGVVVAAGSFHSAGGRIPGRIARWSPGDPGEPTATRILSATPSTVQAGSTTEVRFEVTGAAVPQGDVQIVTPWGGTCRATVLQGKCSIQGATPGTYAITAIYGGDLSNQSSLSASYELIVF